MWKQKQCFLILVLLVLLFPTPNCASDRVRVAYPAITASLWPMWAANDQRYYVNEGLETELIHVRLGTATITQALLSGGLDLAAGTLPSAIASRLAGAEVVIVAAITNAVDFEIYGGKRITSFEALRGKMVASGSKGSGGDVGMMAALQYGRLVPGRDVDVIYIGNSNDRLMALRTERVQATVLTPPVTRVARLDGFNRLLEVSSVLTDWVGNGFYTRKQLLQQNPDLVQRFLRATYNGVRLLKTQRKRAVEIGMRHWKAPESEVVEYYDEIVPKFSEWGEVNSKGLALAIAQIAKQQNQTPLPVEQFLDTRFVAMLKQGKK